MRSQMRNVVQDTDGDIRAGLGVELFVYGTTTPIPNVLYASATSLVALNPSALATNGSGEYEYWIDGASAPVTARYGGASGTTEVVYFTPDPTTIAGSNVLAYGAKGDGTTDDTAAIQAALAATNAAYLPAGSYLVSGIALTGAQQLIGAGANHTFIILKSSATNTTDAVTVTPNAVGSVSRFGCIRDVTIYMQSTAHGRHGIMLDLSGTGAPLVANYTITACHVIGSSNGRAVANTPNGTPVNGPAFSLRVFGNWFEGGVKLTSMADSIWIDHNLSSGANVGIEFGQTTNGAAAAVIEQNNIVNDGGGIWIRSQVNHLTIRENYCEKLAAWSGGSGNNALIDLDGTTAGDLVDTKIIGNQLSLLTGLAGQGIRVKNGTRTTIDYNTFNLQLAGTFGATLTTGASGTRWGAHNALSAGAGTLLNNVSDTTLQIEALTTATLVGHSVNQVGNVTFTSTYARYQQVGRFVEVQAQMAITGAGTTNNQIVVTLPSALAASFAGSIPVGAVVWIDQSDSNKVYHGQIVFLTPTTFTAFQTGQTVGLGGSPNIPMTNLDTLAFSLRYELAVAA